MIVEIGLPRWFAATGPRAPVKHPDSRGVGGFFVAILSVVTQFDACPVGGYNCRTEFFGKDTMPFQYHTRESRSMHCSSFLIPFWFSSVVPGSWAVSSNGWTNHCSATPTSSALRRNLHVPANAIVVSSAVAELASPTHSIASRRVWRKSLFMMIHPS